MIQKNLIIILGTEPRILCSEVICKNNSSMTQLNIYIRAYQPSVISEINLILAISGCRLSANEEIFNEAAPPYQQALKDCG